MKNPIDKNGIRPSGKLSIFIPTYNRCNLLKDALNSLVHDAYEHDVSIIQIIIQLMTLKVW